MSSLIHYLDQFLDIKLLLEVIHLSLIIFQIIQLHDKLIRVFTIGFCIENSNNLTDVKLSLFITNIVFSLKHLIKFNYIS